MAKIIKPAGWQGITRVGQRVICVEDFWSGCSQTRKLPEKGKIYTVAGFCDNPVGEPAIFLREVEATFCKCWNTKLPFQIEAFRPVDEAEKKTDISVFEKMLRDVKVPEDA